MRGDIAPPGLANTTRFENVNDARLRGAELELRYDHPAFYAGLVDSLIRGDDEDEGDPLAGIPADQVTVFGAVRLPAQVEVGARVLFAARQDRLENTTDPDAAGPASGYTVADLFMSWQPSDALNLGVRVDNVFDKNYRTATTLINQPGRNIGVQLSYQF